MFLGVLSIILASFVGLSVGQSGQRPHVVFVVADDVGWNDVSWHNRNIQTPNLAKLARNGIILNSSYASSTCSPSRASFMTGYFPYHLGLQHSNVRTGYPTGVPFDKTFLSHELKAIGYDTHIVGKWHLGYCNWNYTPTYRGFDSFYGFYNSGEDYYTHRAAYRQKGSKKTGLDFTFNKQLILNKNGTYSTHAFTDRAIDVINSHSKDKPLFLYLPFQAAHGPLQVPERYSKPYRKRMKKPRATFSGMVTALDEAVGKIVTALKDTGIWNNTLLVFTSDNGGMPNAGGNNYPLRGGKFTLWEGGVRTVGFIHGKRLNSTPYVYDGLFHAVDWFPTILSAVGAGDSQVGKRKRTDGKDHWQSLTTRLASPRTEFVYNIDQVSGSGAIRVGDYKLIVGDAGAYDGWIKPGKKSKGSKGRKKILSVIRHPMHMLNMRKGKRDQERRRRRKNQRRKSKAKRGRKSRRPKIQAESNSHKDEQGSIAEFLKRTRKQDKGKDKGVHAVKSRSRIAELLERMQSRPAKGTVVSIGDIGKRSTGRLERSAKEANVVRPKFRLFNIRDDPEERKELSAAMLDTTEGLYKIYKKYEASAVPIEPHKVSPLADPSRSGDAFVPGWC